MSTVGVDASFTHQDAAQLARDGVRAVGRYAPPADPGKCITAEELQALNAHGIAVWLVHERAASQWRGGRPAGLQHGAETRLACRKIGWPDSRPIYAPYDESVGPADHDTFVAYQQGFNDGQAVAVAGAAYGDGYVLRILSELGLIGFKWLSDSSAFPESAEYARSGQASIVQFYGRTLPGLSGIDVDDLLVADFGQHPAPSTPIPSSGGSLMSRMVSHSDGGNALVTLNADGTLLIAQGCRPFDEHDTSHVTIVHQLGDAQVFHPSTAVDEIVATVDGHGILCRFHNGKFDVAKIAHGEVR